MSLLTIAQAVAEEIQLPEITSVIGNSDKNTRQIRRLILSGGNTLCQKTNSQGDGWAVLNRTYEFETVSGKAEYDLPSDFKKFIQETAWKKDAYWKMRGSLSGRRWERLKNRQSTSSYNSFRIKRTNATGFGVIGTDGAPNILRKFTLEPAPGEAETLVYEYVSEAWWVKSDGTAIYKTPQQDSDESMFGDQIHIYDAIWRYKMANGFSFSGDLANFEDYRDSAMVQDEASEDPIWIGNSGGWYGNSDESDVGWCPNGRW